MMATKERNFQPLPEYISLEDLVPEDNFYRRLQQKLDLSFVRDLVEDLYAASGPPSVDPEVFFRLQLVMFHEGIRSERERERERERTDAHRLRPPFGEMVRGLRSP